MIFIDNKKTTKPVFDLQLPPSCFTSLGQIRQAFLKFDQESDLNSLEVISNSLQSLQLDLVQQAHNSNKVFNLDFKVFKNLGKFLIREQNILFPVTINISNLSEKLEEFEIKQYKPPVINGLEEELERLFKKTKGVFNLRKLIVNAEISKDFLDTLAFLKNIEVLGISCDQSVDLITKFQKLRELTVYKFQVQELEVEKLPNLKRVQVEEGILQFTNGIDKPIKYSHSLVKGLAPYSQKKEISAIRLTPQLSIQQEHLSPLQQKSDVIQAVALSRCAADFDKHFTTIRENLPKLKKLELKLRFSLEEYDLKLEDYSELESLDIINTNSQESLWFFEIKKCRKLKQLNFDKVHSLSLNLQNSLDELNLKVNRKLLIESEDPQLRIKKANLGFFHARNLEFLRFVERANIEFNFNMISPISKSLVALLELSFKNTHRIYSKILKEISAHAPNLRYLQVEFELTTTEKELILLSDSLKQIVLINPIQGLKVSVEGDAEPEFDIIPQEKKQNVALQFNMKCHKE